VTVRVLYILSLTVYRGFLLEPLVLFLIIRILGQKLVAFLPIGQFRSLRVNTLVMRLRLLLPKRGAQILYTL
jgi:hypothetical protein